MSKDELIKGKVLYDDGEHKFIWLGWEEEEEEGIVQVNQYLIVNNGIGILLDPGGVYAFSRVVANVARYIDLDRVKYIFFSHQDPDVSSGVALWLSVTPATVYISKLWIRFLPHFGVVDHSRIHPVEDRGDRIDLPTGDFIDIIPAHYLHSVGNFSAYDSRSKILFSGDIGAAVFPKGNRYLIVRDFDDHLKLMEGFHRRYMKSPEACKKWVEKVSKYEISMIAPQHGAIFSGDDVKRFLEWIKNLRCGIDILEEIYG